MKPQERSLPSEEARDLLQLVRDISDSELAPHAATYEEKEQFPRELFRLLGKSGLLGLPYPEELGGGGQPYEVYLQVIEELSRAWAAVGMGVSVHVLSCFPLATAGSAEQQERWLPDLLAGDLLGAYCLSEPESGSDAASLQTSAVPGPHGLSVTGTKAWITHAGAADFYSTMVRTGGEGPNGISCLLIDAATPGISFGPAERKMGMRSSTTAQVMFDNAIVPLSRMVGSEGEGFRIAMSALDSGRLGLAACAVGVAEAALELASEYADQRQQFGRSISQYQGISFMLADMATGIAAARALYLEAAGRKDAGQTFGQQAAMAKLFATDTAMKVTTDAIQILGGSGYSQDFPAERYFREAKLLQIVEGTNQIQRLVISRGLSS